ncbi:glycosyltransferase family 32 protein [Elioraea thermophila]|uniref:glycosyltransferase family 32 protein n=1 Tax=Elioraea thermophila TaxID=2185104 RepID=UPI000DF2061F|nr:glycosyltransferase [Elioraea thermophila]
MIPKTVHFVFGMADDFIYRFWTLLNHVCVMSAVDRLKPDRVLFHCGSEPLGPWWRLTRPHVEVVRIKPPAEVFGNKLLHYAHKADVVRLQVLLEHGGIYLDSDVFVHRDFDDLLAHSVVLGEEGPGPGQAYGLCNGVILAEPNAPFLRRWFDEYRWFRSRGKDEFWAEHSVRLPLKLAREHPDEITIVPYNTFHWPLADGEGLTLLYGPWPGYDPRSTHANHLWQSLAKPHAYDLTPGKVRRKDSAFARWASPYLADLPDDFGLPYPLFRIRRKLRHLKRKYFGEH